MGRLVPKVHSLLGLIIHMTNCGAITPFSDTFTFKGSGYARLVTRICPHAYIYTYTHTNTHTYTHTHTHTGNKPACVFENMFFSC